MEKGFKEEEKQLEFSLGSDVVQGWRPLSGGKGRLHRSALAGHRQTLINL